MITVTLYYTAPCAECEEILKSLDEIQQIVEHRILKIDVCSDSALEKAYPDTPVLQIGPYRLTPPLSKMDLQVALMAAKERASHLQDSGDRKYQKRLENAKNLSGADRFGFWLSKHYMAIFNLLVFLYVGLPFLAPVFMKLGMPVPAKAIYTIYSPLCHQLAFRSFFLFGDQLYYPRALANIGNLLSYESFTGQGVINLLAARSFIGNVVMGYKVALCQRDIAIYGAILLFGFVFVLSKRRIKSLPWYLWIILGLFPIGLDGFSQLPGLLQNHLPSWIVLRESTPFLRELTGGMFGFATAWYVYPILHETMMETRRALIQKMAALQKD
ncbi:MAG: DUF2085 domain-containing protein [Anaerolineaceae bacterium]|nr:DUF2085 domain-containing protein [Anaerolineaceae bacterium]